MKTSIAEKPCVTAEKSDNSLVVECGKMKAPEVKKVWKMFKGKWITLSEYEISQV